MAERKHDYVPRNPAQFNAFMQNLLQYVEKKMPEWDIRDTPPESPDELTHHAMASRTPYTLHFEESQRGKTVYIALAWQNERGILGQWSAIKPAIIP